MLRLIQLCPVDTKLTPSQPKTQCKQPGCLDKFLVFLHFVDILENRFSDMILWRNEGNN